MTLGRNGQEGRDSFLLIFMLTDSMRKISEKDRYNPAFSNGNRYAILNYLCPAVMNPGKTMAYGKRMYFRRGKPDTG